MGGEYLDSLGKTDLATFTREVVLPDCPPPLFALGHSMGATVLIRVAPVPFYNGYCVPAHHGF